MKKIKLISLVLASQCLSTVFAYEFNNCSPFGGKKTWENGVTDNYYIAQNSMNASREAEVESIIIDWNEVEESTLNINYSFQDDNDGIIDLGDGRSEIGVVTDASFYSDNAPNVLGIGVTKGYYKNFKCYIKEADAYFPSSVADFSSTFQSVFTHELGHTVGFAHTAKYGLMVPVQPGAHNGDHPYKPLPDDRKGLGVEYANGQGSTDLSTSQYKLTSGNTITNFEPGLEYYVTDNEFVVCPGDTISPIVTNLNFGTAQAQAKNKFTIKNIVTNNEIDLLKVTTTINKYKDYTRNLDMVIPSSVAYNSVYSLFGNIDHNKQLSELDESNNEAFIGRVTTKSFFECVKRTPQLFITIDKKVNEKMSKERLEDFQNALSSSDKIFEGRLIKEISKEINGSIYTYYTFDVSSTIRSSSPMKNITLTQLGGQVNKIDEKGEEYTEYTTTSQQAHLEVGEKYLILSGPYSAGQFVGGEKFIYKEVMEGDQTYYLNILEDEALEIKNGRMFSKRKLINQKLNIKIPDNGCSACDDVDEENVSRVRKKLKLKYGKARIKSDFLDYIKGLEKTFPFKGISNQTIEINTKKVLKNTKGTN